MSELRHLQMVVLDIMRDIDALCQKNDIEYYLLGGSAIGAIRHKGFIPWDDDLDIIMDAKNYERFIYVCRQQLDMNKYIVQEGLRDWPLYFTKIKLKGTYIREEGGSQTDDGKSGIFLDVFKLDNVPNNRFLQIIQYVLAKYYVCYQLSQRHYESSSLKKKCMLLMAFPLKLFVLRNSIKKFIEQWNNCDTAYWGFFYGRTTLRTACMEKRLYGKPLRVPFEDMMLPVPEYYHEYLTQMFGDYMTPPPIEKQVGLHVQEIDFGKY